MEGKGAEGNVNIKILKHKKAWTAFYKKLHLNSKMPLALLARKRQDLLRQ